MSERPDPSVFEEPAHRPPPSTPPGRADPGLSPEAEPVFRPPPHPDDPRLAPGEEPALRALPGLPGYGDVYRELRSDTSPADMRNASLAAGLVSLALGLLLIPVVVAASFVWGPPAAVALIAAPTLALVERRPWLVAHRWVPVALPVAATVPVWVVAVAMGTMPGIGRFAGFVFAASLTAAAVVVGVGLSDMWRNAHERQVAPRLRDILPHAVAGAVTVLVGMLVASALLF